ncbi:DUF1295 domain-containing protein [Rhodoblastus sp.]|uniref:DUF1295 domain-containing protein n=1 Tax=Rhodoblastus sp. TaxID=1962975 RepID=UPI003F9BEF73
MEIAHFVFLAAGLSLAMTLAWCVQRRTGSSGWIDAIWSFSVGGFGVLSAFAPPPAPQEGRALLVACLVGLWALRLGSHIALRSSRGGEDPRYADLAKQWGEAFPRRLLLFLQVQALAALVLVAALRLAATNPAPFPGPADVLALIIALIAVAGESLADAQLQRFRRRQSDRNSFCESGLWRWSRHPNYFFEWLFWLTCPLLAIDLSGNHPCGWLALAAPALMYVLLAHVSGVPPLEAHMLASRGESFRALQRRVNAFFPGPRHE